MVGLTLEFTVCLIFSTIFKKLYPIFLVYNRILKMAKGCFQDTENVFNNIVVNKLKTVNPTYLTKVFYLLN